MLLEFLYEALRSTHGVCLQTDNVESLRAKLYAARKASLDPDLDVLSFQPSPTDPHQLWITKKGPANG